MSGESHTRTLNGTLEDKVRESPVDRYLTHHRWRKFLLLLLLVLVVLAGWLLWRFTRDQPVVYSDVGEHYKYGSLGAEPGGSLLNPQGGVLPPPKYPFPIDQALASQGAPLYRRYCTDCHADHTFRDGQVVGARVGTETPIAAVGTDPFRLNSYTFTFATNQYGLYPGSRYRFHHFRKTNGYANHPLDGIWARAPYLHNGSVPTMRDLLEPPQNRPPRFYRGYDVYDQKRLGFVSSVAAEGKRRYYLFDTAEKGNGNQGNLYGTQLSPQEKDAIVEYMRTF